MDPGLGSGVGGCGKGGEGFTGGRKGARLRDSELEFLGHGKVFTDELQCQYGITSL